MEHPKVFRLVLAAMSNVVCKVWAEYGLLPAIIIFGESKANGFVVVPLNHVSREEAIKLLVSASMLGDKEVFQCDLMSLSGGKADGNLEKK